MISGRLHTVLVITMLKRRNRERRLMKLSVMVFMFFEKSNSVIYFRKTLHFSLMIRDCVQPRYLLSFCSMIASKQRCLSVLLGVKGSGEKEILKKERRKEAKQIHEINFSLSKSVYSKIFVFLKSTST